MFAQAMSSRRAALAKTAQRAGPVRPTRLSSSPMMRTCQPSSARRRPAAVQMAWSDSEHPERGGEGHRQWHDGGEGERASSDEQPTGEADVGEQLHVLGSSVDDQERRGRIPYEHGDVCLVLPQDFFDPRRRTIAHVNPDDLRGRAVEAA
jgi:hypothetical protein